MVASGRSRTAALVDGLLEALVVPSFTKIGPLARGRLDKWSEPSDLAGKLIVLTGASSGLGAAAARELAAKGARLHLLGRDSLRTAAVADEAAAAGAEVAVDLIDLSDLDAVAALGARLEERYERIDGLVHNAGALSKNFTVTSSGHELTVASQLLGPHVLTAALAKVLWRSPEARVVIMSSGGMYTQRFDLATLEMTEENYDGVVAYARVKRAQVLLAEAWARYFAPDGPSSYSMHPGWVATPGVAGSLPGFSKILGPLLRTPEQGVDTLLWLLDPTTDAVDGGFYLDRQERSTERWPRRQASRTSDPAALLAFLEHASGVSLPPRPSV